MTGLLLPGQAGTIGIRRPVYCAEAKALFARLPSVQNVARKRAIDRFIRALKAAGVWSKLDVLHVLAAGVTANALLNWKGASYTASLVSAPTFTANSGYAGNGSSSYVDSGFNPATAGGQFAQNDMWFGVYGTTDGVIAASDAGWFASPNGVTIRCRDTGDIMAARANQATAKSSPASSVTSGIGLRSVARNGASSVSLRSNGVEVATDTAASAAIVSGNLRYGSSSAAAFTSRRFGIGAAGAYLTVPQDAAFAAAADAFLAAIANI